jgi:flagella basal body P-ring formation protein FlgA
MLSGKGFMKQASNSLLTLCPIPFQALPGAPVLPRDIAGAKDRHLTPFFVHRKNAEIQLRAIPSLSCPPRSFVRYRLGEGRIRSLLQGILALLLINLGSTAGRAFDGQDALTVNLKEEATVRSNIISLQDVVDPRGVDPGHFQEMANILLGTLPEDGSAAVLSRARIQECIQADTGPLSMTILAGAEAVRVRVQAMRADPNAIAPLLKPYLLETTSWKGSDVEILSMRGLNEAALPSEGYEIRLSSKATVAGPRRILAPVEIIQAGKTLKRLWITADVTVRAPLLTAAKGIAIDKVITPDDIVETIVEIPDLRAAYARRPDDLLGKVSRRVFSPGDPLTRDAFVDPFLVRHGETVHLRLERNGIILKALARAEQNGRLGQVITVRNLDFSTTLKAEVTGRASVRVQ